MKPRWKYLLAVFMLTAAFSLAGCEGDDGATGPAGPAGAQGPAGDDGPPGQPGTDGQDGQDGVVDLASMANSESCATCHGSIVANGEDHQAIYDAYITEDSDLTLSIDSVESEFNEVANNWAVTMTVTITKDGAPFVGEFGLDSNDNVIFTNLDQQRFYIGGYADGMFPMALNFSLSSPAATATPGEYTVTGTTAAGAYALAPELSTAFAYAYIADEPIHQHELAGIDNHVHLYDNVANAGLMLGDGFAYDSVADDQGCARCHGSPYMKHGYRAAVVPGLPDFVACKVCHLDDRAGSHEDWQFMVDNPLAWATGGDPAPGADYAYTRKLMYPTHMAHAMEFPYPQSMSNCATCHTGDDLGRVTAPENFTLATCKSCHPVEGIGTWPKTFDGYTEVLDGNGRSIRQPYYQAGRAPALQYLWTSKGEVIDGLHDVDLFPNCLGCHNEDNPAAPAFSDLHSGYDPTITREDGVRYETIWYVTIDDITLDSNHLIVEVSASDAAITPSVYVSFYGWSTKQMYLSSHERTIDGGAPYICPSSSDPDRGCRMETRFDDGNPMFSFSGESPGPYTFMLEMDGPVWEYPGSRFDAATETSIPVGILEMIADGKIRYAEVTAITGITGTAGVTQTFDLETGQMLGENEYFKGTAAIVDTEKCDSCHDQLATTFHGGGRGGDIVICKNCHYPANDGSHYELQSRSIDAYVHAVHSFQLPDPGSVDWSDPVEKARAELHTNHVFPNFTITNCEACHNPGTYNVPDQLYSMPSWQSSTDDIEDVKARSVGYIPDAITGPASRSCGSCHRAHYLKFDLADADNRIDTAGALINFNAHTEANGTYIEDPEDGTDFDRVVWDVIDKLMSYFQ